MDYSNPLGDGDPRNPEMQRTVPQRLQAAQQAVKAIGTNAIPTLLELIQSGDQQKRDMASAGFMVLGKDGSSAAPSLIQLTNHKDSHTRLMAAECLIFIDPAANKVLIEVFTRLSRDADASNRVKATNYLRLLSFQSSEFPAR